MKRRLFAIGVAISMSIGFPHTLWAAPLPFPDMDGSWYRYREAVQYLKDRGTIGGYPDGTFQPGATINRAELLKIIFKGKSDVVPVQRRCFSDVNPDQWYAPYVCAAKNRGIVNGYPNGTFRAGEPVNFAEAIKIVLNAYGHDVVETAGEKWYESYVEKIDGMSILASDSYIPWEPLTRERAADLLWRMLRYDEESFLPNLSPGCGKAIGAQPSSVVVDGHRRSFLLTVPSSYVEHDPASLVIAFHGRTNSNEQVREYYRLDRELRDAVIAYPEAESNGNGSYNWSDGGDTPHHLRDIKLFDAIVEQLAASYCIDMSRIFVVGHSLGGWFSNSLACVRGDVIRASVSVGGSSVITDCAGPSAAMIIHNPKDQLAPFSGSEVTREQRVKENSCTWQTEQTAPETLSCVQHAGCSDNPVVFCPHTLDTDSRGNYYPHNWPTQTATYISDFFNRLP